MPEVLPRCSYNGEPWGKSTVLQMAIKYFRSVSPESITHPEVQGSDLKLLQIDGESWTLSTKKEMCSNEYGVESRRKQEAA